MPFYRKLVLIVKTNSFLCYMKYTFFLERTTSCGSLQLFKHKKVVPIL
jgi:hypothetical protein